MTNLSAPQALTPLERELLILVERLTDAFETTSTQLKDLEAHSTALLDRRLTDVEALLEHSLSSQRAFNEALVEWLNAPELGGR